MSKRSGKQKQVDGTSPAPASTQRLANGIAQRPKAEVASASATIPPTWSGKEEGVRMEALPWTPVVEGSASKHPVVFTQDGNYFFVAVSSSVKIHSRATGQVVSTLSSSPESTTSGDTPKSRGRTGAIIGLLLNPFNPLQLITASLDGTVKVWDYLDAVLLKSISVGYGITHIAAHSRHKNYVFVAVRKPAASSARASTSGAATGPARINSVIFRISLDTFQPKDGSKPTVSVAQPPRELVRVGKTREATGMHISADGEWLVAIGGSKVHVARLSAIRDGFTKYVSSDRLVSLAFHPHDNTFATGDEKGQIRMWYLLEDGTVESVEGGKGAGMEKRVPTTTLHWHAHAVSSLTFTSNGAYLLSGGEEAVLVIWRLGSAQKEFIPRVGAAINSIALARSSEGREQEYAVGLVDGSTVFVSATNLKVVRTISRVKIDPSRKSFRLSGTPPVPLEVQPSTGHLVVSSGHPSSIQFFNPATDSLALELEVAPSNRVSRANEKPIEPPRVERVVFSGGQGDQQGEWMATFDTRDGGEHFTSEAYLKIWRWDANTKTYILNTRIERPHDAGITAMSFSPVGSTDSDHLLVTAGKDNKVKTWRIRTQMVKGGGREVSWVCRSSFSYREHMPRSIAWAPDGTLMAVAQGPFVTLWEPATNALQHVLSCPEIKQSNHVTFAGQNGRFLLVAGPKTLVAWDLIACSVQWCMDVSTSHLVADHSSRTFTLLTTQPVDASSSLALVFDPASPIPIGRYTIPARVRQAVNDPFKSAAGSHVRPNLVVITDRYEVGFAGDESRRGAISGDSAQSVRTTSIARKTMFDDLFGSFNDDENIAAASSPYDMFAAQLAGAAPTSTSAAVHQLFDAPSHALPPVTSLWKPFMDAVVPPRPALETDAAETGEKKNEDVEEEEDRDGDAVPMEVEDEPSSILPPPATFTQDLSFLTELFRKQMLETETTA